MVDGVRLDLDFCKILTVRRIARPVKATIHFACREAPNANSTGPNFLRQVFQDGEVERVLWCARIANRARLMDFAPGQLSMHTSSSCSIHSMC
jgi:hypothetical protein